MLQAPCGMLNPLCVLYRRCVSCLILYVGYYSLHACCAGTMCAVLSSMRAVAASVWAVTGEYRERRKGTKTGNEGREPRKGTNIGNEDRDRRQGTKMGNQDR